MAPLALESRRLHPLAALARRQHGVATRSQLRHTGLTGDQIYGRILEGLLNPLFRGVYQIGIMPAPLGHVMAACLASGPGARLGFFSAALLWKLLDGDESPVHVIARGCVRRRGICAHRIPGLRPCEVTRLDGIPVTRPARTLLDLADRHGNSTRARPLTRTFTTAGHASYVARAAPARTPSTRHRDPA